MPDFFVRRDDEQSLAGYFSSYRAEQTFSDEAGAAPAPLSPSESGRPHPTVQESGDDAAPANAPSAGLPTDALPAGEAAEPAASRPALAPPLFFEADEPIGFSSPSATGSAADLIDGGNAPAGDIQAVAFGFEALSALPDVPLLCGTVPFEPPLSAGRIFYVDTAGGSDGNSGLAEALAFKSLAKVQSMLQDGDTIQLKCGSVFHEQLRFSASQVMVQSYGSGANPLIDGDGARHGIVVQGENALIRNIDVTDAANGIYVTGDDASAAVIGGHYTANGTGIVAGGGGRLILVDGAHCTGSRTALGAGDGIQISADASSGVHTIQNVVCEGNAIAGVNAKAGTVTVADSVLSFNGEPGWIAQNNTDAFDILRCRIEGNNRSDNGTGQASIEDGVVVHSTGNLYLNPHNGAYATVQINIVTSSGWMPDSRQPGPTALYSAGDTFVNTSGQTNTVGSIQVLTGDAPAIVSFVNAVFDHAAGSGVAVRAPDATGLALTLDSSVFNMTNTAAVIVDSLANILGGLATNDFRRTDGGTVLLTKSGSYDVAGLSAQFPQNPGDDPLAAAMDLMETALAPATRAIDFPFDHAMTQSEEPIASLVNNARDQLFF